MLRKKLGGELEQLMNLKVRFFFKSLCIFIGYSRTASTTTMVVVVGTKVVKEMGT